MNSLFINNLEFSSPIYLDNAASTQVDPKVAEIMSQLLLKGDFYGNAASKHAYGTKAREVIERARGEIAAALSAEACELIFTSGATESINLAIKGAAKLYQKRGKHIITVKTEHKATLDACYYLAKQGWEVTFLSPAPSGLINLSSLQEKLRPDTVLISIMHVNNETGVIQDLTAIGQIAKARGIFFHTDATQSMGKLSLNWQTLPVDLLSFSAHKMHGPKGVGGLLLRKRPRVRLEPLLHGGGHEQGMRSGTLATHQIAGMAAALSIACEHRAGDLKKIAKLRELFLSRLQHIRNFKLNCDLQDCSPYIVSVRFENMMADEILKKLPMIAASTASACQGHGTEGSYVLRAMGLTGEQIKSSIRFSFARLTTEAGIIAATDEIRKLF